MVKSFDDLMVEFVGEYKKNFSNLFSLDITRVTSETHSLYLTERNQSANFVKAIQNKYPNAIAWYEFPFNKNQHLDVMVYIPSNQDFDRPVVLLIESKNLRTPTKKIPELIRDVIRINSIKNTASGLREKLEALFSAVTNIKYYGVILCDVQKTDNTHKEIAANWSNGAPVYGELSKQFEKLVKMQQRKESENEEAFQAKISKQSAIASTWPSESTPLKVEYSDAYLNSSFVAEHYKQLIRYWPIEL